MAKKKKKSAITMVSLLLTLVVLIGVYTWYSNRDTKKDTPEDTKTISLVKVDTTKVTAIHYVGMDYDMNFILKDGIWKSKEEPDRPINQGNVSGMLATISNIEANQVISDTLSDVANFGLDKPKPWIEVTMEDGSKVSLKLGMQSPTGDGYYALVNNLSKVYLLDSSFGSGLTYTKLSMTEIEKAPEITATNINYLNIDKREGEDIEVLLNENGVEDNSGFGTYKWQYIKPYGDGYTADSTEINQIQQSFATFTYNGCADYKGDDLAKYGLDKPTAAITVGYYVDSATPTKKPDANAPTQGENKVSKRYKIYIGNKADDDNYYVRVDGLKAVYLLGMSTVESMIKVDAFTLVNKYAALVDILRVDKITANVSGTNYVMDIKTTKTKDANDKEVINQTFKFNGKDTEEETFKTLYRLIDAIIYEAPLKEKVDISKLKQVFSISFHLTDQDAPVSANVLSYNDSFDIVDKGTGKYFLVDKRKIEMISDAVKNYK